MAATPEQANRLGRALAAGARLAFADRATLEDPAVREIAVHTGRLLACLTSAFTPAAAERRAGDHLVAVLQAADRLPLIPGDPIDPEQR